MLEDISILDLSRLLPGPYCTWLLRGLGATVDRVEPIKGDPARFVPPKIGDVGSYFASFACGARSLALDFRHPGASALLLELVQHYDVLVEGFRPGVLEAIGLSPQILHHHDPGLIIARISGYGQNGQWAQVPGHDINYASVAGLLACSSLTEHGPALPPAQIADVSGAQIAALQISAALYARTRGKERTIIDVSLSHSALATNAATINAAVSSGCAVIPGGESLTGGLSIYGCYICADGSWISVGAIEDKFRDRLLELTNRLDRASLKQLFLTHPRHHWLSVLNDACVTPVLQPAEVIDHPAVGYAYRDGFVQPPTGVIQGLAPNLGQHSAEMLRDIGWEEARISVAHSAGLISSSSS